MQQKITFKGILTAIWKVLKKILFWGIIFVFLACLVNFVVWINTPKETNPTQITPSNDTLPYLEFIPHNSSRVHIVIYPDCLENLTYTKEYLDITLTKNCSESWKRTMYR